MCLCTFIREMGEVKLPDSSIKGLRKYSLELWLKAWVLLYQEDATCCCLHCCELFTQCLLPANVYIAQEQFARGFQQPQPVFRCFFLIAHEAPSPAWRGCWDEGTGHPAASGRAADVPVAPALGFSGRKVFSTKPLQNLLWCRQEENTASFLSLWSISTLVSLAVVLLPARDNSGATID